MAVAQKVLPVFDAKGDSNEAFSNSCLVKIAGAPGRMGRAAGMTGQRFDSAERDGIAGKFQMSQKVKGGRFTAAEIYRDETPRIGALIVKDPGLFGVAKKGRVIDFGDFGMAVQLFRYPLSVLALPVHTKVHGGETRIQNPALVGLKNVTEQAPLAANLSHQCGIAGEGDASDDVAKTSQVLGCRIEADVGAESEGMLERGPEKCIVDHDERTLIAGRSNGACVPDVRHDDGWIRRGLDQNDFEAICRTNGLLHRSGLTGNNGDTDDTERLEETLDEGLSPSIDRDGIKDAIARSEYGQQGGHDGSHARVEDGGGLSTRLERQDLIFENLGVGVIESRIDEIDVLAGGALGSAAHDVESALGRFGTGEDVGGTAKDGGPGRADGQSGVKPSG